MNQILLNDKEVAQLIGCGASTIWRWVKAGQFPQPIKICGVTRWRKSDIEQFIDNAGE